MAMQEMWAKSSGNALGRQSVLSFFALKGHHNGPPARAVRRFQRVEGLWGVDTEQRASSGGHNGGIATFITPCAAIGYAELTDRFE
jgi:hypothetical protein